MRLALFQPDIPQNTGTLLRLGACLDLPIDIIEPCGFIFNEKAMKRAGMDYLNMIVDKAIRTIDLMHYAWNIGNLFKKKGIDTATFIKQVFADALVDVEISTILRKLRMEGTCIVRELLPSLDVQGGIKTHYCC